MDSYSRLIEIETTMKDSNEHYDDCDIEFGKVSEDKTKKADVVKDYLRTLEFDIKGMKKTKISEYQEKIDEILNELQENAGSLTAEQTELLNIFKLKELDNAPKQLEYWTKQHFSTQTFESTIAIFQHCINKGLNQTDKEGNVDVDKKCVSQIDR
eukprot:UN29548